LQLAVTFYLTAIKPDMNCLISLQVPTVRKQMQRHAYTYMYICKTLVDDKLEWRQGITLKATIILHTV